MDSKRRFPLAAWEYFSLSNQDELDKDDQLEVLKHALTCAILCPAGDTKFKILGVLYKDERSKSIDPHFDLMEKFFMSHIIKRSETQTFEEKFLVDH